MTKLDNLKEILKAIKTGEIKVGVNKEYCFVWCEDGELYFLKRPDDAIIGEKVHPDYDDLREQWPLNETDGEELWYISPGGSRGRDGVLAFLEALEIGCLG